MRMLTSTAANVLTRGADVRRAIAQDSTAAKKFQPETREMPRMGTALEVLCPLPQVTIRAMSVDARSRRARLPKTTSSSG